MSRDVVWHGQSQTRDLQVAVARYSARRFNDMVGDAVEEPATDRNQSLARGAANALELIGPC
jgi:hypothetical protein